MGDVKIIPLEVAHYAQWLELYKGYADHYKVELTKAGVARTWDWLHSDQSPVTGIVVVLDGRLVGLAHYRAMPSPLRGIEIGFLDDMFVGHAARGAKVGEKLLGRLAEICTQNSWPMMRWITRDNNYRARSLYDRVAVKADWNTYEMLAK